MALLIYSMGLDLLSFSNVLVEGPKIRAVAEVFVTPLLSFSGLRNRGQSLGS